MISSTKPRRVAALSRRIGILLFWWANLAWHCLASPRISEQQLQKGFEDVVRPFLKTYCLECHGAEKPKGDFDLTGFNHSVSTSRDLQGWELVLERMEANEMPPRKAEQQPSEAARKEVLNWIQVARRAEGFKRAGDPGVVLPRRLNNAEYENTIRDLTGQNLRVTREFPVDPANQAGFDNSGESLVMSPALLKKYLQAARSISEHLLMTPDGIGFAPHPVVTDTDRDKYCVLRIVDFYKHQPTDYADYFEAAWKYRHRVSLGIGRTSMEAVAEGSRVSARYLQTIWTLLEQSTNRVGPVSLIRARWNSLPPPVPKAGPSPELRRACERMRDEVLELRSAIVPFVENLSAPGINPSAQCLVLWKDREWASNRRRYDPALLHIGGKPPVRPERKTKRGAEKSPKPPVADPRLEVPEDPVLRRPYLDSFERFASVFPDTFYVSERARAFLDPEEEKANGNAGRLLSAGLHSMTGYFRDDGPLCELILDDRGRQELDRLWSEFDYIASVPQRMHKSTLWFERTDSRFMLDAEFDFARPEDKDSVREEKVKRLADVYYAKAQRTGANERALAAIRDHFERVWLDIDRVERQRATAEERQVRALEEFAVRAYRGVFPESGRSEVRGFYTRLRKTEGLDHEEAMRDTLASILVSPRFLYRADSTQQAKMGSIQPLDDVSLASRLSYFLWSTLPDAELLSRAQAGDLHRRGVLLAQVRRMLADPRARALATEFFASWLDIRRFEEWNSVDRERFPQFDSRLREAMAEEPVRFFMSIARENRSILDFVYGRYTFVNEVLAKHYGMPFESNWKEEWVRVGDARQYGRGGILPMAIFLTKNAPGLRTSPVKRGYWIVRRVLGRTIPPPPPNVPVIPNDESKLGESSLRDTLAHHRDNLACAGCHNRFDAFGLVFEGYGPIGERRTTDLGGRPVDVSAVLPDKSQASGLDGLVGYLHSKRESEFVETFTRQLFAYALGRTLTLFDDSTIEQIRTKVSKDHHRFQTLVESIVLSPQFLNRRGP